MKKFHFLFLLLSLSITVNSKILKKPIPRNMVVLTFDDATESQYSVVAPLLKRYGFNATFFVCEFPSRPEDRLVYMNRQQIRELNKMGFEIANHTRNHVAASKVSKEKLIEELEYIEGKCDSAGIGKPTNFAYPGYDLSLSVMNVLHEKGYEFARAGGSRAYDPLIDYPLLIPSWAMNATNKEQIMAALQEAHDGKIVVLTIHGVPDLKHPWVNTPPELFTEYLRYLSENKYKVLSLKDLKRYVNIAEATHIIVPDMTKKFKN